MSKKLTPWFPGDVKPAHIGVYERPIGSVTRYSYWDGKTWRCSGRTPELALQYSPVMSVFSKSRWGGLASVPKGAK